MRLLDGRGWLFATSQTQEAVVEKLANTSLEALRKERQVGLGNNLLQDLQHFGDSVKGLFEHNPSVPSYSGVGTDSTGRVVSQEVSEPGPDHEKGEELSPSQRRARGFSAECSPTSGTIGF